MKKSLRLLFVEDGEHNKPLVCRELVYAGYLLTERSVHSLSALEQALNGGQWDLILSDYHLPGFTYHDVLHIVQARQLDVPVIVISRSMGEGAAVEVMQAGARDFIRREHVERVVPAIERELAELAIHRARQQALQQLAKSEERYRQLSESIEEVFWLLELHSGQFLYVSPSFEQLWERPTNWLLGDAQRLLETLHPEDYQRIHTLLAEQGWAAFNVEFRILRPGGEVRWVHSRAFPVADSQGARVEVVSKDVTERQKMQMEMLTMVRALEQTADVVMITDSRGRIEYVNPAFESTTGFQRSEVLGKLPSILKSGFQDEHFYTRVWESLRSGLPFTDIFINRRKDGELYYESKTITPVRDNLGEITHYVATGKDITERIRAQERLQRMVNYDPVTGLATRLLLLDRLEQALLGGHRQGWRVGVLHIEFDLALILNVEQEQALQERLLQALAQRLRDSVGHHATVARISRQEFVVMERFFGSNEELDRLALAILGAFAEPVKVQGCEAYVAPSIGIATSPEGGNESELLLQHAAEAMRYARQVSHQSYHFYKYTISEKKGRLSN